MILASRKNATLTLFGLQIGFSISMAISRHDLRKRLADTSDRSGCRLQAFFLIPGLDSPHGSAIRVAPHNLISLSESRQAQ
jgi:hypothetical protein